MPLIRAVEECGGRAGKRCLELLRDQETLRNLSFLIDAIRTKWPSVKKFAAHEMETLRSPSFVDPLLTAMDDEDLEVRMAAIRALRKFLAVERVASRLVEAIGYGDLSLRQMAIETIGEASLEGTTLSPAIDPLIRALGNRFLRKKAEVALKRMRNRNGLLAIKRRRIRDQMSPRQPRAADVERLRLEKGRAAADSQRLTYE